MKLKALFIAAAVSLVAMQVAQACDVDAARMAIHSANEAAENAATAANNGDSDSAKSYAADAADEANSAEVFLSDCE